MRPLGTSLQLETRRLRAIEFLHAGMTYRQVADKIRSSLSSVVRWKQDYKKHGEAGLKPKPASGRPALLSPGQKKRLAGMLLRSPLKAGYRTDVWTLSRIRQVIETKFGVRYTLPNIWKILTVLGWSCQKPVKRARERDEKAIAKWKRYQWPHIKKSQKTWRPSGVS